MGMADVLYLTEIHKDYEGDAWFPEVDLKIWQKTDADDREGFSFVTYKRGV